jgi:hypothetical protein
LKNQALAPRIPFMGLPVETQFRKRPVSLRFVPSSQHHVRRDFETYGRGTLGIHSPEAPVSSHSQRCITSDRP